MAAKDKPQVPPVDQDKPLTQTQLKKIAKDFRSKLPRTVDGRMYLKRGSQLYVETAPGSGKLELSKRNLARYNTTLGKIARGKLDPGLKARTEADSARFAAERDAKAGVGPKRGPGRPRKDGSPAQSRKANGASSAADPVEKTQKAVNKTLQELGPDKPKNSKPLAPASKTQTRPIADKPSAPKSTRSSAANRPGTKGRKPTAPKKPVASNNAGADFLNNLDKSINDAIARRKAAEAAKAAEKPAPVKPNPRAQSPSGNKRVLSPQQRAALTRAANRVKAAEADAAALKAKGESVPKPAVEAPKTPAKGKTPGKGSKASTTPPKAPKRPSNPRKTGQKQLSAIDAAKAKIDQDVKDGKVSKREGQNAKNNLNARKKTVVKSTQTAVKNQARAKAAEAAKADVKPTKPLTSAQKAAATRAANKAKAQSHRLPGNTFDEKLKNFKAGEVGKVSSAGKWVRVGGKLLRGASRVAGPVGLVLTAAEAARLGTTASGQREYAAMRRAIDMGIQGKDVKGKDLVRKGTMYTAAYNAKKESDAAKRKKMAQASSKAGDARAQGMTRAAYRYTVPKGPRPSGESYSPSSKQTGKGNNRPSVPATGKYVRVQRGDTLWGIAQKNNTTVSALYKANPTLAKRKAEGRTQIYSNTLVRVPRKK